MSKREKARELVTCLNILNDLALEGRDLSDSEVQVWLQKYFVLLKDYHGGTNG